MLPPHRLYALPELVLEKVVEYLDVKDLQALLSVDDQFCAHILGILWPNTICRFAATLLSVCPHELDRGHATTAIERSLKLYGFAEKLKDADLNFYTESAFDTNLMSTTLAVLFVGCKHVVVSCRSSDLSYSLSKITFYVLLKDGCKMEKWTAVWPPLDGYDGLADFTFRPVNVTSAFAGSHLMIQSGDLFALFYVQLSTDRREVVMSVAHYFQCNDSPIRASINFTPQVSWYKEDPYQFLVHFPDVSTGGSFIMLYKRSKKTARFVSSVTFDISYFTNTRVLSYSTRYHTVFLYYPNIQLLCLGDLDVDNLCDIRYTKLPIKPLIYGLPNTAFFVDDNHVVVQNVPINYTAYRILSGSTGRFGTVSKEISIVWPTSCRICCSSADMSVVNASDGGAFCLKTTTTCNCCSFLVTGDFMAAPFQKSKLCGRTVNRIILQNHPHYWRRLRDMGDQADAENSDYMRKKYEHVNDVWMGNDIAQLFGAFAYFKKTKTLHHRLNGDVYLPLDGSRFLRINSWRFIDIVMPTITF